MKKKPAEPTHGGARIGAGKKPSAAGVKVTKSHRFTPEVANFLETVEKESEFIEALIRDSPAFQSWSKKKAAKKKPG